jgi:hypothetical protein
MRGRHSSFEAAKRVEKLLATASEGNAVQSKDGDSNDDVPELDADLIRVLAELPLKGRFGCGPPARGHAQVVTLIT